MLAPLRSGAVFDSLWRGLKLRLKIAPGHEEVDGRGKATGGIVWTQIASSSG
jgi:hypothetical protein